MHNIQLQYLNKNFLLYFLKYIHAIALKKDFTKTIYLKNAISIVSILHYLKYSSLYRYTSLLEITTVDLFPSKNRFLLIYKLLSYISNSRLHIMARIEKTYNISVTSLYIAGFFHEREVFDLFGILFKNNNDLRRLLTDYGFIHFPFRKDFPMTGLTEIRFNDQTKKLIYEPLELQQKMKNQSLYKEF